VALRATKPSRCAGHLLPVVVLRVRTRCEVGHARILTADTALRLGIKLIICQAHTTPELRVMCRVPSGARTEGPAGSPGKGSTLTITGSLLAYTSVTL